MSFRGSHWCDIDPRLPLSSSDTIIEKDTCQCVSQPINSKACIDSLVVTGLTTSGCVRASAVDGLQHNFKVVIPEEATGDRDPSAHQANLYDLNAKYVDVMPLDKVLALL